MKAQYRYKITGLNSNTGRITRTIMKGGHQCYVFIPHCSPETVLIRRVRSFTVF